MTARPPWAPDGAPPAHRPPRCHAPELGRAGSTIDLPPDEAAHLARVLRLHPGDAVEVFDGEGRAADGRIDSIGRHAARVVLGPVRVAPAPAFEGILVQALPKGEKKDLIVRMAVETGLARLIFVEAERSVVRLDPDDAVRRTERWMRIAVGAAKQCGRDRLPRIDAVADLPSAVASAPAPVRIFCEAVADARPLRDLLREASAANAGSVAIFVGPEGGFAADEIAALRAAGARPASLGPLILRTESAALVAMGVLLCEFAPSA